MPFSSSRISILAAICLCVSLGINPAKAANWSVANWVSDAYTDELLCKFEVPLEAFLAQSDFFKHIHQACWERVQLHIEGKLTLDDLETISQLTLFLLENPLALRPSVLYLNSGGGSVSAALGIARSMRDPSSPVFGLTTIVLKQNECSSSCVMLLAAGMQRSPFGAIGIHRPRFVSGEYQRMGYGDLQSAYAGLYNELKVFFQNVNIHSALVEDMWNTPSDEIRILSKSELTRYRLNQTDLISKERQVLNLIAACGEEGPQLQKAFHRHIDQHCTNPRNNKIDFECHDEELIKHPYYECYKKL